MRAAETSRREPWIEAARTLACGLVVLMHVNAFARAGMDTWWPGGYAIGPLLCATVPAFLLLAGFLQAEPGRRRANPAWLVARLRRLLLPMLAWSAVMLLLGANAGRRSVLEVVLDLTTGVQHLYYLGVLAQITIALALLQRLRLNPFGTKTLVAAAAVTIVTLAFAEIVLWRNGDAFGSVENWLRRLALPWTVFYFLGGWLRDRSGEHGLAPRRGRVALGGAAAAGYLLYLGTFALEERTFGYVPRTELLLAGLPFQVAAAWLALALLERWQRRGRAAGVLERIAHAGGDTFGIYLVHFPVLIVLYRGWNGAGMPPFSGEVPATWAVTWLVSLTLVRGIRATGRWPRAILLGEEAGRRATAGDRFSSPPPARQESRSPRSPRSPRSGPRTAPAGS